MVVALTIRTDRFRAALKRVESGKNRLEIGEGDVSGGVGHRLSAESATTTDE